MKLLCLSDLHIKPSHVIRLLDDNFYTPFTEGIFTHAKEVSPDAVVITGDTVSAEQMHFLSALLRKLIPGDLPIVATLGNHECWGRTFEETLQTLKEQTITDRNIFYLDLIGSVELGGINFVGGMLFFDGSMRYRWNQRVEEWNGWMDWKIVDVETRYLDIHRYYADMIKANMKSGMPTALCTHHLAHEQLNGHKPGHFNFYSGVKDLVSDLPFDPLYSNYLICGHTHRRVIGNVIPGFMGINVGSEYGKLESYVLEC